MTASLLIMPIAAIFGVSMFYPAESIVVIICLLAFVLFATFAIALFNDALRLLSKSEKQPKKIVHKLYTEEEWKNIDKYSNL